MTERQTRFERERERRLARALAGNGSMRKAKKELARRIEERRRARLGLADVEEKESA